MKKRLTSDQFVTGVFAELALRNQTQFKLPDIELDERFERAFESLLTHINEFNIVPIFSFFVDPFHGDSTSLRETLLSSREKRIIAFNNPTYQTFDIILDDEQAKHYLEILPIPRTFFTEIVDNYFSDLSNKD
jgi:hypothetical protein